MGQCKKDIIPSLTLELCHSCTNPSIRSAFGEFCLSSIYYLSNLPQSMQYHGIHSCITVRANCIIQCGAVIPTGPLCKESNQIESNQIKFTIYQWICRKKDQQRIAVMTYMLWAYIKFWTNMRVAIEMRCLNAHQASKFVKTIAATRLLSFWMW